MQSSAEQLQPRIAGLQILIPEILSFVLSFYNAGDLASIIIVCHSWSELVLDCLWGYHLTSIIPLLKILGPMVQRENTWTYASDDGLRSSDWSRFRFYAVRVRKLRHDDSEKLSDDYLSHLALFTSSSHWPLLPRLHDLTAISVAQDFKTIWPFLSQTIKKMAFVSYNMPSGNAFGRVLQRLIADPTSPRFDLAHLRLEFGLGGLVGAASEVARYLNNQPNLRSLYVHRFPVAPVALQAIKSLEKLHETDLTFLPKFLTNFELIFRHLGEVVSLHSLAITLGRASTAPMTPFTFQDLRTLLRLRLLVKLELIGPMGILLEPSDVSEMKEAFPDLTTLHFPRGVRPSSSSPLSVLVEIARSFGPALTSLSLQVSCHEIPDIDDSPPHFTSLRTLTLLNFDLVQKDVQAVAALLARLCAAGTVTFKFEDRRDPTLKIAEPNVWEAVEVAIREHRERRALET